jgi:hypothetical protein
MLKDIGIRCQVSGVRKNLIRAYVAVAFSHSSILSAVEGACRHGCKKF